MLPLGLLFFLLDAKLFFLDPCLRAWPHSLDEETIRLMCWVEKQLFSSLQCDVGCQHNHYHTFLFSRGSEQGALETPWVSGFSRFYWLLLDNPIQTSIVHGCLSSTPILILESGGSREFNCFSSAKFMMIEISAISPTRAKVRKDFLNRRFLSFLLDFQVINPRLQHFII